ncbi:MAG: DUF5107 domain-containing protein, partial [Planctomycetota bacterium]
MKSVVKHSLTILLLAGTALAFPRPTWAQVKAWEGTLTIPTYPWQDDVNPKFWALEGGPKLSTTVKGSIIYPYTMQDHLSRNKGDRTYKALFLENEYLRVICLPELGGRIHSVLDKTRNEEMFHLNRVIKPGMIAMRGAWISGGIEWNSGPHGHTVTCVSPVEAAVGKNQSGSASLEISNQDKIFRTRWSVRLTLHPGKAYLDEEISIYNPTDGMHPYYFWNCTAFPCHDGTRFIYPMTLGTDHDGRKFFNWPVHEGKDLSWLKNYETYASVFAVDCSYDFFGAYDVKADRGIVQVANHHVLPGKKAWTWGTWDFGLVAQESLTDEDGPYIEVQSGPLPTQSDYGMLAPHQTIAWQEWWYPVHGLDDGFEYATKDVAVQASRKQGNLELRVIATAEFPDAKCRLARANEELLVERVSLSPRDTQVLEVPEVGEAPVEVTITAKDGQPLASFVTPLPVPKVSPPDPSKFVEKPDDQLTVEEKYLKGRKFDRDTNRQKARQYYEMALADDPGHVDSLRSLAVLDLEAGLYEAAIGRLKKALDRDPDDGLSWYFLGVCHLRRRNEREALRCGHQAAKYSETSSLGNDLAGRALMRLGEIAEASAAFGRAGWDLRRQTHSMLAWYASGPSQKAFPWGIKPLELGLPSVMRVTVVPPHDKKEMDRFFREARAFLGEYEFNVLESSLIFADLGLAKEAAALLRAACVDAIPKAERSPLPLYYLAYYTSLAGDEKQAEAYLREAAGIYRDFVFPSRVEAVEVFQYALRKNSKDAHGHLHLGNLFGGLGRVDEAVPHWRKAAKLKPGLSMAFRNLGLVAASRENDLAKAADLYRKAIAARPEDQTLYRDLAEILIADQKRPQAIRLLETMPVDGMRRSDVILMLAGAYRDEKRFDAVIGLLESTPYFVNWEGQDVTWVLFNEAHVERGRRRLEAGQAAEALADFEAALTYPENLG